MNKDSAVFVVTFITKCDFRKRFRTNSDEVAYINILYPNKTWQIWVNVNI